MFKWGMLQTNSYRSLVCVDGTHPRLCRSHGHRAWCRFPPARNSRSGAVGSSPNKSNSFHCAGGAVVKRRWLCAVFTAELTSTIGLIGASGHQARFPRSLLPLLPPPHANPPSFRTAPTFCSTRTLLLTKKACRCFQASYITSSAPVSWPSSTAAV